MKLWAENYGCFFCLPIRRIEIQMNWSGSISRPIRVGRSAIQSYADFKGKVKSSMHSLQRNTEKIRSFSSSQKTRSDTPPECLITYVLINNFTSSMQQVGTPSAQLNSDIVHYTNGSLDRWVLATIFIVFVWPTYFVFGFPGGLNVSLPRLLLLTG